jgi:hypothetical protein
LLQKIHKNAGRYNEKAKRHLSESGKQVKNTSFCYKKVKHSSMNTTPNKGHVVGKIVEGITNEKMIKRPVNARNVMKRKDKRLFIWVGDYVFKAPKIQKIMQQ